MTKSAEEADNVSSHSISIRFITTRRGRFRVSAGSVNKYYLLLILPITPTRITDGWRNKLPGKQAVRRAGRQETPSARRLPMAHNSDHRQDETRDAIAKEGTRHKVNITPRPGLWIYTLGSSKFVVRSANIIIVYGGTLGIENVCVINEYA